MKLEFQLKDFVLFVPIVATAVAASYDVGYFFGIGIGLFTLFSLSEHILFALVVLPLAVVFSTGMLFFVAIAAREPGSFSFLVSLGRFVSRSEYTVLLSILVIFALAVFAFTQGVPLAVALMIALLPCIGIALGHSYGPSDHALWGSFIGMSILCVGISMGVMVGRAHIYNDRGINTVVLEGGEITGSVLRTGDRGILIYDAQQKQLVLIPWALVKRMTQKNLLNMAPPSISDWVKELLK